MPVKHIVPPTQRPLSPFNFEISAEQGLKPIDSDLPSADISCCYGQPIGPDDHVMPDKFANTQNIVCEFVCPVKGFA